MTAIVLPDLDKSTIDELRKRIPDLREIELPSMPRMEHAGKTADQMLDRLLGRSKSPVWPWVAAGLGLVAVVGAVAAYFAFWRRPGWDSPSEPWADPAMTTDDAVPAPGTADASTGPTGLTAAESSLTGSYNPQEA